MGNGSHSYAFAVLVYGYAVSTFFVGHGTWTINSLTHVIGKKIYETGDDSKNHWFLAIITMGEGWHNNHHYYRHTRQRGSVEPRGKHAQREKRPSHPEGLP